VWPLRYVQRPCFDQRFRSAANSRTAASRAKVAEHHLIGVLPMHMTFSIAPLVALIAGVLILVVPRLLNYIVAIYLIVTGLLGLFGAANLHIH
jgi:cytochrome c biogenesis protein CcdA